MSARGSTTTTPLSSSKPARLAWTHFGDGLVRLDWSSDPPPIAPAGGASSSSSASSASTTAAGVNGGAAGSGVDAEKDQLREQRRTLNVMRLELLPPCDDDTAMPRHRDGDSSRSQRSARARRGDSAESRIRGGMRHSNRNGLERAFMNLAESGRVTHTEQRRGNARWLVAELLENERVDRRCDLRLWPTTAGPFIARVSLAIAEYQYQHGDEDLGHFDGLGIGLGIGAGDGISRTVWETEEIEIDTGSVVLEMTGTGYYVPGSPYRSVKLNDAIYCRTSTINANKSGPLAHRGGADGTTSSPSQSPQKRISSADTQSKLVVSTSSIGDKTSSSVPLGVFCAAPQADDRSRKSGWAIESGINVLVLDKRSLRPIFDKTYNTYAYGRARAGEEAFVSLCDDFCGSDLGNVQKFKFTADDIFIVTVRHPRHPCVHEFILLREDMCSIQLKSKTDTHRCAGDDHSFLFVCHIIFMLHQTYHGFEITRKMVAGNPLYIGPRANATSPRSETTDGTIDDDDDECNTSRELTAALVSAVSKAVPEPDASLEHASPQDSSAINRDTKAADRDHASNSINGTPDASGAGGNTLQQTSTASKMVSRSSSGFDLPDVTSTEPTSPRSDVTDASFPNDELIANRPLLNSKVKKAFDMTETSTIFAGLFARIGLSKADELQLSDLACLDSRSDGKGCQPASIVSFGHRPTTAFLDAPSFSSKRMSLQKVILCYDSVEDQWLPFFHGRAPDTEIEYMDLYGQRSFADFLPILRSLPRMHRRLPKCKVAIRDMVRSVMRAFHDVFKIVKETVMELQWDDFCTLLALHSFYAYLFGMNDVATTTVLMEEGVVEWISGRIVSILSGDGNAAADDEMDNVRNHVSSSEHLDSTERIDTLSMTQKEEIHAAVIALNKAADGAMIAEVLRRGCGEAIVCLIRYGFTASIAEPLLRAVDRDIGFQEIRISMPMRDSRFVRAVLCGEAGPPPETATLSSSSTHVLWIEDMSLPDSKKEVQLLSLEKFKANKSSAVRQSAAVLIRPQGATEGDRLKTATGIAQQASRLVWQAGLIGARVVVLLWPAEWAVHLVGNPNFLTPHSTASRPFVSFLIVPSNALPEVSDLTPGFNDHTHLEVCPNCRGGFAWEVLNRCGVTLLRQMGYKRTPAAPRASTFVSASSEKRIGGGMRKMSSFTDMRTQADEGKRQDVYRTPPQEKPARAQSVFVPATAPKLAAAADIFHSPKTGGRVRGSKDEEDEEEVDDGDTSSSNTDSVLFGFQTISAARRVVTLLGGVSKVVEHVNGVPSPLTDAKPVRILSLDGGGTRGLASIEILEALCNVCGSSVRDLFDFVIGTSTGGLIAISTAIANFSLEKTKQIYLMSAQNIFKEEAWSSLLLNGPGYNAASNLEGVIDKFLGEKSTKPLIEFSSNTPKVCLVSTLISRAPSMHYAFRNYRLPNPGMILREGDVNGCHNACVRDALRASSAAPYYLYELNLCKDLTTGTYTKGHENNMPQPDANNTPTTPRQVAPCANLTFIDGGITANNPTAIAIHEVRQLFGSDTPLVIVSIGTGRVTPHEYSFGTTRSSRFPSWIQNMFFATGDVDSTDAAVKHTLGPNDVYERFHPVDDIFGCSIDDVRPETLEQLVKGAKDYIQGHMERFVGLKRHLMRFDDDDE